MEGRSRTEQVEKALLTYIHSNHMEVGDRLPNEYELGQIFDAGRSTIREAVKGLESQGILQVKRGAGTYITSTMPTANDPLGIGRLQDKYKLAMDLVNVRLILEPELAALAAEHATKEQIEELEQHCNEVEERIRKNVDHTEADVAFHTCIAAGTQNAIVERLVPIINSSVVTFVNVTHRKLLEQTITNHRRVMEAIKNRDVIGARCAMTVHLTENREMIMKLKKEFENQEM